MEPVMPEAPMDGAPLNGEMGEMGELMETVGEFDPDWDPFDPDRPDPFLESLDAELDEPPPVEVHNTSAAGMAMGAAMGGAAGTAGAAKAASSKQPAKGDTSSKPAKATDCSTDCYHSRLGLAASSVPDATKQPASDEYDGPYMGYNTTMPSLEEIKETNRQHRERIRRHGLESSILAWIVAIAVGLLLIFVAAGSG